MGWVKKASAAAENQVQAAASAVAPMSRADGGNPWRVARGREPLVDGGADLAAPDRRLARAVMSGDQKDDAVPSIDRLLERPVDGAPGAVETHSVKVDDAVRFDRATAQSSVPASIQRGPRPRRDRRRRGWSMLRPDSDGFYWFVSFRWFFSSLKRRVLARQRLDRRRDLGPQLGLFRAERAHARRRPWAAGSAPRRK